MLVLIKRLGALLRRNPKSRRRRLERQDPLLSGPPQPDARLHGAPGEADPNARFLGGHASDGVSGGS